MSFRSQSAAIWGVARGVAPVAYDTDFEATVAILASEAGSINVVFDDGSTGIIPVVGGVPLPYSLTRINTASTSIAAADLFRLY